MFVYLISLLSCIVIKPAYTSSIDSFKLVSQKRPYHTVTVYPSMDSMPVDSTIFSAGFVGNSFVVYIKAYQKEKIAASILKDDQEDIMNDDWILIMLDTEGKSNSAYCFQANPRGTKRDFMLSQGGDKYVEWDGSWKVKTQKTDYGYSMLFIIPLNSITYTRSRWGIRLERFISEKGELQAICNTGSFQGLEGIASINIDFSKIKGPHYRQGRNKFELLPSFYIRGFVENSYQTERSYNLMYGGNIRIKRKSSTVFDLAIHPDFSDIEADIQEISISRKPFYYPEKRPFFMEGRDLFVTPINLLRTRNFESVNLGLKFYTKARGLSFITYLVSDEVFDTMSFGKVNFSLARGCNAGLQYIFSPSSYKFLTSDFNLPVYKRKNIGAKFQFSRRFDSASSLLYGEIYKRSEFTGLNVRMSFTHVDRNFLTQLQTLYFDNINEVMLNVDYGISLHNGISLKPSVFYYEDHSNSNDTLIDRYLNTSLLLTRGKFSLTFLHQREDMPYLPYNFAIKSFKYSGLSFIYSKSSYENLEINYLTGKYLGFSSSIKSMKLKVNPFGMINLGIRFDDYSYDRESGLSDERLLQVFGIVSLIKRHLVLKPYVGYHITHENRSLFSKNVIYLSVSENLGVYGVFQLNGIKGSEKDWYKESAHTLKIVYNF